MDKKLIPILLTFALLLYGCTREQVKQCPASCDDNNACTIDYCDASTNFGCKYDVIKNCYGDYKDNFSIIYPDGWEVVPESKTEIGLLTFSPQEIGDFVLCNMEVKELPSGYSLMEYVNSEKHSDFSIMSEKSRMINGLEGYELVGTIPATGVNTKFQEFMLVKNGKGYRIYCATGENHFDKYKSNFESIITSFKFE